jgi:ABC-type multidrug transport system fused ATPase/permease subunit
MAVKVTIKFHPIAYVKAVHSVNKANIEINAEAMKLSQQFEEQVGNHKEMATESERLYANIVLNNLQNDQVAVDHQEGVEKATQFAKQWADETRQKLDAKLGEKTESPTRREYIDFSIKSRGRKVNRPKPLRYNLFKAMYNSFINSRIKHHELKVTRYENAVEACDEYLDQDFSETEDHRFINWTRNVMSKMKAKATKRLDKHQNKVGNLKLKLVVQPAPGKVAKFFSAIYTKVVRPVGRFINKFIVRPIVVVINVLLSVVFLLVFLTLLTVVFLVAGLVILLVVGVRNGVQAIKRHMKNSERQRATEKVWESVIREAGSTN